MTQILFNSKSLSFNHTIAVSADKSISHRAIIFASLSKGKSTINNLLLSLDVYNTMNCFAQLGVVFTKQMNTNNYVVISDGFSSFNMKEMQYTFDMGNSGTSTRLLAGLFSSSIGVPCVFNGDASLSKRPMKRIINPLREMGADISASGDNTLPLIINPKPLHGINYRLDIPSAQVKSGILLAGLFASSPTTIIFKEKTRDHTEKMLHNLGVTIKEDDSSIHIVPLEGNLPTYEYTVPGDFSSAAFFIVATLITQSTLLIKNVNLNPLRCGLLESCLEMGADISILNKHMINGEPCGDIYIKPSTLRPINLSNKRISTMIDEFPIYFVLCAFINGKTTIHNLNELKVKESDRLNSMVINFKKMGIQVREISHTTQHVIQNTIQEDIKNEIEQNEIEQNGIEILGNDANINKKDIILESFNDHRIAMSLIIMALRSNYPIGVKNCENIATSFPNFINICKYLNFNITHG